MRRLSLCLLTLALLVGLFPLSASAETNIFTKTVGFAAKTGYRGIFSWQATQAVNGVVHLGTSPDALDLSAVAIPGAPDTAQMAIYEGLEVGSTYYWRVEDALTGQLSDISSFEATNAYTDWNGSAYTLDLLVQLDTQALPPGVPADLALQNIAQGINIFGERLYDAMDGFARLGNVLITDTNLDYGVNIPSEPIGCFTGLTNAADVLIETSVPFDSHTFSGWAIDEPCTSFYVGRIGQLVVPWGTGGSAEDLHFGYVSTHEMMHYAFNAPDLYDPADINNPRVGGCWNLDWDGSLMHNDGGWAGNRWEFTELDRNPSLTPCDHSDDPKWTWDTLRERYTNVPLRPAGPIEHVVDDQARGNADGGAMNIQILDREPGASTLSGFTPNDLTVRTDKCTEPGFTVLTDVSYDSLDTVEAHDIQSASVAEPYELGAGKVVFGMKVSSLSMVPPNTTWPLVFRDPAGVSRWVRMSSNALGQVSFAHGTGNSNPYFSAGTPALAGSSYSSDGKIRIVLDRSSVGLAPGDSLTKFIVRVRIDSPDGGANGNTSGITPDNMPNDTTAPTGIYTAVGSENCLAEPPVANDDSAVTAEDVAIDIPVLSNDTDPSNRPLSIGSVSTPANGTAVITGSAIRYTPSPNFNGADSFTYSITTSEGGTDSAVVDVAVTPVADAPIAFDDRLTMAAGTSFRIPVLDNDTDQDGDAIALVSASDPPNGTTQVNADGTVRYTPDPGTSGTDSFNYTISDGALTDSATVVVQVMPEGAGDPCTLPGLKIINDPANDQTAGNGGAYDITSVSAGGMFPTGQIIFTMKVTGPLNPPPVSSVWRVRFTAPNGTIYYVSMETLDLFGTPTFRYGTISGSLLTDAGPADTGSFTADGYITLGVRASKLGLVTPGNTLTPINAQTQRFVGAEGAGGFLGMESTSNSSYVVAACLQEPPNDAPSAIDDYATMEEDNASTIAALANDTDRNGDPLLVTSYSQGTHGSVSTSGGSFLYTPDANFYGDDSFTYTISDGRLSASAVVHVTVNPVNDRPVSFDDALTTDEDTTVVLAAAANDSDVDGDALSVTSVTAPLNGTASVNPDGTITYSPGANYNGTDLFSYVVSDGNGGTDSGDIVVTINAVNDPPVANDDAIDCVKGRSVTFSALANDSDVEDVSPTIVAVYGAAHGTTRINLDGSISYTPVKGFKGTDSFTYTVADANGATDTAQVTITIVKQETPHGTVSAPETGILGFLVQVMETLGII